MYRETLLLGAATALLAAGPTAADFKSVLVEPYVGDGWVDHGYAGLTTFRVYAEFDGEDPEDGVMAVWGSGEWPLTVTSQDGTFHNAAFDSLTAPIDLRPGIWENQWDTYVTVGKDNAQSDRTTLSPDFANECDALAIDWTSENLAWFVLPADEQGKAVPRGDGHWSVLVGQFTVQTPPGPDNIFIDARLNVLLRDGSAWVLEVPCRVPENLNGDAEVGFDDLLLVLNNWGCTGDPCQSGHPFETLDIDDSGEVDFGDLLRVLNAWNECEPFPIPVDFCGCCDGPCDADLNDDGLIDFDDLLLLLVNWDTNDEQADINCNGVVDIGDLLFLLLSWGECP